MTPFCDWLTTTRPPEVWPDLLALLQPYFDGVGLSQDYADATTGVYRTMSGSVRQYTKHGVHVLSISGGVCALFRTMGLWGSVLANIGSLPHRCTMTHLTLELPEHGPSHVLTAKRRCQAQQIQLTRKALGPQDWRALLSLDARGQETGTVYMGTKQADVQAVVYDKRHEREGKGFIVDEDLVRYELRIRSGVGATLRDAWEPAPLFWHYAGRSLLPAPATVQAWAPHAEGFALPDRHEFTAAELLDRKLDTSPDVERLLDLAAACGPHGFDLLARRLRSRYESRCAAVDDVADSEALQGPSALRARPPSSGIH